MAAYERVHVIAHSHGGSIAVRAAWLSDRRISSIVTIGTPFFAIEDRPEVLVHEMVRLVVIPLAALLGIGLAIVSLISIISIFGVFTLIEWIIALLIVNVALAVPIYTFDYYSRRISNYLHLKGADRVGSSYDHYSRTCVPTLCIFNRVDEARRAIKASLIVNSRLKRVASRTFYACLIIYISLFGLLVIDWVLDFHVLSENIYQDDPLFYPLTYGAYGFYIIWIISFIYMLVGSSMSPIFVLLSLGWRSAVDALFVRIKIENLPQDSGAFVHELRRPFERHLSGVSRLRHSGICYQDETIEIILDWLGWQVRGQKPVVGLLTFMWGLNAPSQGGMDADLGRNAHERP